MKLGDRALEQLMQHQWPGNIRELEHTMEKTVILSDQSVISDIALTPGAEIFGNQMANATLNLEEHEKMVIVQALREEKGNVSATAITLGINRSTLYQKMKKYGL